MRSETSASPGHYLASHVSPAVRALFPHDEEKNGVAPERRRSTGTARGRTPIQPVIR